MQLAGGALLIVFAGSIALILGMGSIGMSPHRTAAASPSAMLPVVGLGAIVLLTLWWRSRPRDVRSLVAATVMILIAGLSWPIAWRAGEDVRLRGWLADARPAFERKMDGSWRVEDGEVQRDLDGTLYRVSRGPVNMGPSRGVVYDVTGMLAAHPRSERRGWKVAPAAIADHFGGGLVFCRPIREIYFFCRQES